LVVKKRRERKCYNSPDGELYENYLFNPKRLKKNSFSLYAAAVNAKYWSL